MLVSLEVKSRKISVIHHADISLYDKNLPLPRYIVKDQNDEVLDSVLNENEIVKYTPVKYI